MLENNVKNFFEYKFYIDSKPEMVLIFEARGTVVNGRRLNYFRSGQNLPKRGLRLDLKEVMSMMLTIEGFIAVISLAIGCFGLGYALGKGSKKSD